MVSGVWVFAGSVYTLAEKGRSDKSNGEQLDLAERERYEVSSLAIVLRELDTGRAETSPRTAWLGRGRSRRRA